MDIDCQDIDGIRLIRILSPRVDAAEAVQFKDSVREAASNGPDRVVLDMSEVKFLDSSGLGAVVGTMKVLAPDRKLELACLTPAVAKVFRLTRMDTIMAIHDVLPLTEPTEVSSAGQTHAI